jgi:flagellar biosynthesis protein FlhB
MKMEKFEVKQEYKDTEGSPEIKGKRRQIAQEIAYDEGPSAVKRAKAVVTNPTHLAVAIGYEPQKYPAPFILAKGMGLIAEAIIREADKHNIAIMRNVPLAHELFENGKVYEYIPAETYEAVAEILRLIATIDPESFE